MSSKQKVVVSFTDKVGIIEVNCMSQTAQRLEADRSIIFHKKKRHDNVIRLAKEELVDNQYVGACLFSSLTH